MPPPTSPFSAAKVSKPIFKAKVTVSKPVRPQTDRRADSGYPEVDSKKAGLDDYLKKNQHVAGMAWGGGENGSDPKSQRVVVVNPYNKHMQDPVKRRGLVVIESARHKMSETGYEPKFSLTPEQQEWRKGLGAYSTDDKAFKQSIVSRLMVGDDVPGATKEQHADAKNFNDILSQRKK